MIEKARLEDCDEIYDLMCILENQKLDYDHFKQDVYKRQVYLDYNLKHIASHKYALWI